MIDLQGRTVIPGFIDSHIHAIRAGQTFTTEVNWVGATSIAEAMSRIHEASLAKKPGSWLIVAGGWNAEQFKEKRRPTQADLVAAAPNNPVYVQLNYDWEVMTPAGFQAMGINSDADLPRPGRLERDANGNPTGAIEDGGGFDVAIALFDKLPHPTFDEQVEGTKKFFREMNRLGVTGVGDPGGNNLNPENYQPVFKVWRQHQLTVRIAYSLCGPTPGKEFEELQSLTQMLPQGFGDDMLKFNGLGERLTWGMNNNDHPTADDKEKYYQIVRWAAQRGMPVTMHWPNDETADTLLSIYERVNAEYPITDLRWSVAHLTNASVRESAAHEGDGRGLDHPASERRIGGKRQGTRREDGRGDRRASRGVLQSVHDAPMAAGRQQERRRRAARTRSKRPRARTRFAPTRSAAPGFLSTRTNAVRSSPASSPTSLFCPRIT